jgi:hypothetical protein
MTQWRVPVDPEYVDAVGRAFYNFDYMEWIVIWTVVKLSPDGFQNVPDGTSSTRIADTFERTIDTTLPPLSDELRKSLTGFAENYRKAISSRDSLILAHPFTAAGGMQELGGLGRTWDLALLTEIAKFSEDVAISGNAIFYGDLAKERP